MSSSKKILNRLDRLFTDIKADGKSDSFSENDTGEQVSIPVKPKSGFQEKRIVPNHARPISAKKAITSTTMVADVVTEVSPSYFSVPFQSGENWSLLQIDNGAEQSWQEDDQNLVRQIADQLGLALQNANLLGETQKTAQRLASVAEIATNISSILELQPLLETTVQLTQQGFGLYHAHIFLLDKNEKTLTIKACGWENGISTEELHEKREIEIDAAISIVAKSAREKKTIVDNDVHADKNWLLNPRLPNVQAELAIPIVIGNRLLGVLNVHSDQLNYFTEADLAIMTTLATQIGSAIQNARLFDETQKRSQELAILNNLVQAVSEQTGLKNVLEAAYNEIQKLVPIDAFFIALYDEKAGMVEFPFVIDGGRLYDEKPKPINPRNNTGKTILLGKTIQDNLAVDDSSSPNQETYLGDTSKGTGSLLFVPLKLGLSTIGCLSIQCYIAKAYSAEDVALIESISSQLSAAILNARLFNQMQANEENFRNLVENAPEAIIVIDVATGHFTEANSNAYKLFGLSADDISKIGPVDLSPEIQPDLRLSSESFVEKIWAAQNDRSPVFEWDVKNTSGKIIPCEIHLSRLPGDRPLVRATVINITERKIAEDEISKFKFGIEQSTDSVFMTDINGKIIYVNPGFTSIYGFTADEAIGNTPRLLKSGLSSKETYEQFWGTLLSKNAVSGDLVNRAKDGRIINIVGTNSPILDKAGNIQGFLAVHHDVTASKKAEESLRDSEAELRALFAAMKDVVVVYDRNGRYLKIAPTDPSLLVRPPTDLLGKTLHDVFPESQANEFLTNIQTVLETNSPMQIEYSMEIGDQSYWFLAVLSPMQSDSIVWVARDVTESKQAQKTLQEIDDKLLRQNEYLAAAAEVGRLVTSTLELEKIYNRAVDLIQSRFAYYFVSIFTLDETGLNAVMREGTGDVGEIMKTRKHTLPIGPKSVVGHAISTGKTLYINDVTNDPIHRPNPLLPNTLGEAAIPLKIGSRVLGAFDIQSTVLNAFLPEEIAILETLADQIAVALDNANSYLVAQKAVTELVELDRIKSQFLANMSHELRTPLNSIIGFSRVILKGIDGPVSEQQQQDLTAIYNSGQHLLGLINDILDLSKIDAGKMELSLEELNITDTINSVISTAMGLVKDKPVKVVAQLKPNIPTVRADPMRIRQVLINLLSNAAKFTEEGSVTVTAEVQTGIKGRQDMLVSVTDTGPGIALEDQAKLFLAFSQVDSSPTRKTGGTGLGLSICQRLIDLHNGTIGVSSEVGKGSTFYFTIPLFHQVDPLDVPSGEQRIVLCVEDDPQVVKLYDRYLKPEGYEITSVNDPAKVVEMAKRTKPFAITLDIMMPEMDGWAILEQIKSDPETRNIPVIICSIVEEEKKGFSLGAADYLIKPIMEEDLLIALNRLNSDEKIKDVLIIDDSVDDLHLMEKILVDHNKFHPILAEGAEKGWDILITHPPHAVILDLFMPGMNGFDILEKLRAHPKLCELPVVVVSGVDLNSNQKNQLAEYGKNLLNKGMLNEDELFSALEKSLRRFRSH